MIPVEMLQSRAEERKLVVGGLFGGVAPSAALMEH